MKIYSANYNTILSTYKFKKLIKAKCGIYCRKILQEKLQKSNNNQIHALELGNFFYTKCFLVTKNI